MGERKQKPRPTAPTAQLKKDFLTHYAQLCVLGEAAAAAGVSRSAVRHWREHDPEFEAEFESVQQGITEKLEKEAIRRAYEGWNEPVFQGGKKVGIIRKFSDTLLIFLLKGLAPHRYRERYEVSGHDGGPISVQVSYESTHDAAEGAGA